MNGRCLEELVAAAGGQPRPAGLFQRREKVGSERVYGTRQNVELELRGGRVIGDLLELLWIGVNEHGRGTKLIARGTARMELALGDSLSQCV